MKRIGIEEHSFTKEYVDYLRSRQDYPRLESGEDKDHNQVERIHHLPGKTTTYAYQHLIKYQDFGAGRIADMDKAGVEMQVLSIGSPGVDEIDVESGTKMAKVVNDGMAKAIKLHPDRFAGFAAIATGDPQEAAKELERAVKELGMKGAKISSHGRGEYLDLKKYWPFWAKAEELDVPIYLHPKEPPPDMIKPYLTYPILSTAMWGFAADAGLHAVRLICSGLFDEHPGVKVIMGHLGESIPLWLWRMDNIWKRSSLRGNLKKRPSEYFHNNFYVTTSGMYWDPAFLFTMQVLGAERILFAVDYPQESAEIAVKFMDAVPISETDREKIYHVNAEKLLKL
jgi:5-carboxyvanillate decarboxylase